MQKTKIPWCDYTVNPIKGLCPMACPYCYARRMYKRFKWNPEIRFEPLDYIKYPAGSRVFVGSTMELFGDWVKEAWLDQIFEWCRRLPKVTFIFLTKKPENLIKWSPFPDNCWVGVSATDAQSFLAAGKGLEQIKATVKFISLEPFLSQINGYWAVKWLSYCVNWLIIGCQTPVSPKTMCKFEWVEEIVNAADSAGIPVFIKPPLSDVMNSQRTEYPEFKRVEG